MSDCFLNAMKHGKKTKFPKALKLDPTGAIHSATALFADSRQSYPHPNSFPVLSHNNPPLPLKYALQGLNIILEINKNNW